MVKNKDYYNFLEESLNRHDSGDSWGKIANEFYKKFGENISKSAMRHRCLDYNERKNKQCNNIKYTNNSCNGEFVQYNCDGSVEESKLIDFDEKILKEPKLLLEKLGYDSNKWELITYRVSNWDSICGDGRKLHSVQYKVKPLFDITPKDILESVKEAFKDEIKPLRFTEKTNIDGLDDNKLMEIPPVELHMGKLSNEIETGENYDIKIAKSRFYDIFDRIYSKQVKEKCGKCLIVIGSDFFNSESDNCTSKDKIPQQNDTRYIKLFTEGIRIYSSVILTLRTMFNEVDVMLCAGNHARAMETFLYMALEQRFLYDDKIKFIENYKLTQAYVFGKCAIFYNHGDANLKQTMTSIPAEFPKIWGDSVFRELHLGHLHKEVIVDDEGGMITRRVGSPCSTDAWHYSNRFVGATKKHQIFIWDKKLGLEQVFYISVE